MSEEHVVNLLRIANNDGNVMLKLEVNSLESRKVASNRTIQDLRKRILSLRKALDACILTHKQQIEKITV
jgi:hypothetical protein